MEYRIFIVQNKECNDVHFFNEQFKKILHNKQIPNGFQCVYIGSEEDNLLAQCLVKTFAANKFHISGAIDDDSNFRIMIKQATTAQKLKNAKLLCLICTCNGEMPHGFQSLEQEFKKINVEVVFMDIPHVNTTMSIVSPVNNQEAHERTQPRNVHKKTNIKQVQNTCKPITPMTRKINPRFKLFFGRPLDEIDGNFKEPAFIPSDEQLTFLKHAQDHDNVLIKSCVGGGKTTMLKEYCNSLEPHCSCLYLMFNKNIKLDILCEIEKPNVLVSGYHGLASRILRDNNLSFDLPNSESKYSTMLKLATGDNIKMPSYNVIIIDEYQDLDVECARFLWKLIHANPNAQLLVAGGMEQRNRIASMLDPKQFIESILGKNYQTVKFSRCYRLSSEAGKKISYLWDENIVGVNDTAQVAYTTNDDELINFLGKYNPEDILCIGQQNGSMITIMNQLKEKFPEKYNNDTVYISSYRHDFNLMNNKNKAICTTYDSCKGLERKINVVFDFTARHLTSRMQTDFSMEVVRNMFCVAMTRGKELTIFVRDKHSPFLTEDDFDNMVEICSDKTAIHISQVPPEPFKESISDIMQYIEYYKEPVDDNSCINIIRPFHKNVDLHACAGMWQEMAFFRNYDIDQEMERYYFSKNEEAIFKQSNVEKKILMLAYKSTHQKEYMSLDCFIDQENAHLLLKRLATKLTPYDECQKKCYIKLNDEISCVGRTDVVRPDEIIELKYVTQLRQTHFIQCAMYMLAFNIEHGILWNTRCNEIYHLTIKDKQKFMEAVIDAINHECKYVAFEPLEKASYVGIFHRHEDDLYDISIFHEGTGDCVHSQLFSYSNQSINYTVINDKKKVGHLERQMIAANNAASASANKLPIHEFHKYSVNKIIITNTIDSVLADTLRGYKMFNLRPLLRDELSAGNVKKQVLSLLQDNTDISKYQMRHHIYNDAIKLEVNERVVHPIFKTGTIRRCYQRNGGQETVYSVQFDDPYYGTVDIQSAGTLQRMFD